MVNGFQAQALQHPPADPADLRRSTPCTGTATCTAPRSSRTTSASAPPATRAGGADRPGHRRGGPRDRHPVELLAVRLRGPRRAVGPHLRELRRGPGAGRPRWRPSSTACRAGRSPARRPDRVLATAKHYAGDGDTDDTGRPRQPATTPIDQGVTVTSRRDFGRIDLAPYVTADPPARRRQRHAVVLQRRLDRGRRRQPGQDARPPRPDHRRAQGRARLRRLRDLATGRASTRSRPGDPTTRPDATRSGPASTPASTCSWSRNTATQFETLLLAEVEAGRVQHGAHRRRRPPDPDARSSSSGCSSTRTRRPHEPRPGRQRRAPRPRPPGGRRVAGAAEEHRQRAAADARTPRSTSPAATPTTSATRPAAGRSPGRAAPATTIPGTTILRGHPRGRARAQVTYSADASAPTGRRGRRRRRGRRDAVRRGLRRRRRPECGFCTPAQLEAKSLDAAARRQAVVDKVCGAIATCVVLVVSGRPQVITDQLGKIDALVASWLPGSEGAGVADVLFGRRPFTGRLSMTWPRSAARCRSTSATRTTSRCSRTAGACAPTRREPG